MKSGWNQSIDSIVRHPTALPPTASVYSVKKCDEIGTFFAAAVDSAAVQPFATAQARLSSLMS